MVEWGDPTAPPLLLAHGGFDSPETMNVFAPMLVAGGWRVVSWDHRGHGDSRMGCALQLGSRYPPDRVVCPRIIDAPRVPIIGHSKGGVMLLHLAEVFPHRISAVVNLDGLPSHRFVPNVAEQRQKMLAAAAKDWLDHRARLVGHERPPGTVEGLTNATVG